jgi:hypothetical protein
MVEYGLTKLENYYLSLSEGDIGPKNITLEFDKLEDPAQSATPYAPAEFQFVCDFPYSGADFTGLPELSELNMAAQTWASKFIYAPDA